MPLPVLLTGVYLVVNAALTASVLWAEAHGRTPRTRLVVASRVLRYGPPLLGLLYLVTIAGDWAFFLFVVVFFAAASWLLNGLLSIPIRPPKRRP